MMRIKSECGFFVKGQWAVVVLALLMMSPAVSRAGTKTWDGSSSGNWNTAANWAENAVPVNGDLLVFPPNVTRFRTTNNLPALSLQSITFSGSNYVLSGNAILLNKGIAADYSSGTSQIGFLVALDASQTFNCANAAASFTVSGDIANGGNLLTVSGSGDMTLSGQVSGSGGLTKSGAGTLILSATTNNAFTGAVTINQGVLLLSGPGGSGGQPIPNGVASLTIGDGAGGTNADVVRETAGNQLNANVPIIINSSGLLDLNGFDDDVGALTFNGGHITTGAGLLTLAGDVTVNADTNSPAGIAGRVNLGATRTFTVTDWPAFPEDFVISASISGAGGITKDGSGELVLTASNSFSGPVTVNGGSLYVENDFALGGTASGTVVNSGGRLLLRFGTHVGSEPLILSGIGPFGSGAFGTFQGINSWAGNIVLSRDSSILVATLSTDELTLTGAIGGPGALTKTGLGKLFLAGSSDNTYKSDTTVGQGTMLLNKFRATAVPNNLIINDELDSLASHQVADTAIVTVGPSGLWQVSGFAERVGALLGSGTIDLGTSGALFFGTNGLNTTFSGNFSGATGEVNKEGLGTTTFSGTNTYSGATHVNSGALLVNGSQPQSTVTIASGAILGGFGVVGNISNTLGGAVAPGASPGILTCSNVNFSGSSSEFRVELSGGIPGVGHDQLKVRGSSSLGNSKLTIIPEVSPFGAPSVGDQFLILTKDGTNPITGTFNGLANGATFTIGGLTFRINYDGGDGNDVVITVASVAASQIGTLVSGGNGIIEPNECNVLSVIVSNQTATPITGISASLLSATPGATTVNAVSPYPDIPAFQKRTNTIPFQLSTAPFLLCGDSIKLELELQTTSHGGFKVPFTLATCPPGPFLSFSNNVASTIPDNSTLLSPVTVSNIVSPIAKVTVSLHATHPHLSDIDIFLDAPDGTSARLTTAAAGTNYGLSCTERMTFDDSAANTPMFDDSPYVGAFVAADTLTGFRGKSGAAVNGIWNLRLTDRVPDSIGGELDCWTLNITPQTAVGSGSCEVCMDMVLAGAAGFLSPHQVGRMKLDGTNSTCALTKVCPGRGNQVSYGYDAFTFRNGSSNACITVTLAPQTNDMATTTYANSFVPTNLCANYLADAGEATLVFGAPMLRTHSFNVVSNQLFVVTVSEFSSGGSPYRLTVTGGDCQPALNISQDAGSKVVLDWTTAAAGFLLETTNALPTTPAAVWNPITNLPVVVNSRFQVTNDVNFTNQFYRLRRPL